MFDIGFSELLVVALVALLVIGPEGMPEAVHKVMAFTRALRRTLHHARQEVEREMGMDDIRRRLHNEEILRSLNAPREAIDAVRQDLQATAQQLQSGLSESETRSSGDSTATPDSTPPTTPPAAS